MLCSLKKNRLLEPTYIEEELIEQTTKILKQLSVVESSLQDESSFVPAEESPPQDAKNVRKIEYKLHNKMLEGPDLRSSNSESTHLVIDQCGLTDWHRFGEGTLRRLRNLVSLDMSNCGNGVRLVDHLCKLRSLTELTMGKHFPSLSKLRSP